MFPLTLFVFFIQCDEIPDDEISYHEISDDEISGDGISASRRKLLPCKI